MGGCWRWPAYRSVCASVSSIRRLTPAPRDLAELVVGGVRRPCGAGSVRRWAGRRHLRVRERAGRGRHGGSAERVPVYPATGCAGRWPRIGSPRRRCFERLGIPHGRVRRRRQPGRPRRGTGSGSALPAILKTRRLGYDGKGQVVLRDADRRRRGLGRARRRAADPGSVVAVPARAVDPRGARSGRRRSHATRSSRTTTARASCASAWRPAPGRRRRRSQAAGRGSDRRPRPRRA